MKSLMIKTSIAWALAAILMAMMICLWSCRSTKVNKSHTTATRKSDATERSDSVGSSKKNVVKITSEDKNKKSELEITFDSTASAGPGGSSGRVVNPPVVINPDGSITLNVKPQKIKRTETDKGKVKDSTVINKSDTASKSTEKKTTIDEKVVITQKKKEKKGGYSWLYTCIAIAAIVFFILWWRKKKSKKEK